MLDVEQAIRERVYQFWIECGRDDGKADAHWLAAQREVLSASLGEMGRVAASDVAETVAKKRRRRRENGVRLRQPERLTRVVV